jgi:hypothetical protein
MSIRQKRCWVCGDTMGKHQVFVIGPMCVVNRTISEPPCHRDCAEFAAKYCPFLANPRMRRNERDVHEKVVEPGGFGIKRNPGVTCLWESGYRTFNAPTDGAGNPGVLFRLGDPRRVDWWAEGRAATRAEIEHSIETGYPILMQMAMEQGSKAVEMLVRQRHQAMKHLPPE